MKRISGEVENHDRSSSEPRKQNGLDINGIFRALFTMMVLMALMTTFITTPLLEWVYPARLRLAEPASTEAAIVA